MLDSRPVTLSVSDIHKSLWLLDVLGGSPSGRSRAMLFRSLAPAFR